MITVEQAEQIEELYEALFAPFPAEMSEVEKEVRGLTAAQSVMMLFPLLVEDWRRLKLDRIDATDGVCRSALETYGFEAQTSMLQEECGELIVAISHYRRNRIGLDNVAEEIADVMIIATQIAIGIEEIAGSDLVREHLRVKAERLTKRIAKRLCSIEGE